MLDKSEKKGKKLKKYFTIILDFFFAFTINIVIALYSFPCKSVESGLICVLLTHFYLFFCNKIFPPLAIIKIIIAENIIDAPEGVFR